MLILLSFGVMFGLVKPKRIGTFLLWLILGPVLIGFAIHAMKQFFLSLSPLEQLVTIIPVALALAAIFLRFALPRGISEALIAALIYDFLKWVIMLPLNVLSLVARLLVRTVGPRFR